MLVMAVLLEAWAMAPVAQLRCRPCDRAGDGAPNHILFDAYLANLAGNSAMIPSLSMSAMPRIWTWISS